MEEESGNGSGKDRQWKWHASRMAVEVDLGLLEVKQFDLLPTHLMLELMDNTD